MWRTASSSSRGKVTLKLSRRNPPVSVTDSTRIGSPQLWRVGQALWLNRASPAQGQGVPAGSELYSFKPQRTQNRYSQYIWNGSAPAVRVQLFRVVR